jgi:hypothetical protein
MSAFPDARAVVGLDTSPEMLFFAKNGIKDDLARKAFFGRLEEGAGGVVDKVKVRPKRSSLSIHTANPKLRAGGGRGPLRARQRREDPLREQVLRPRHHHVRASDGQKRAASRARAKRARRSKVSLPLPPLLPLHARGMKGSRA